MTTDYNGWTNRETWATMLYINNDQYMQETATEYAQTSAQEHSGEEWDGISPIGCLAETVEKWITTLLDFRAYREEFGSEMPDGLQSMRDDIGSLYRVNWREIAESLLSDIEVSA
jgi:hypothetical protein